VLREQCGDAFFQLVERARRAAIAGADDELHALLRGLPPRDAKRWSARLPPTSKSSISPSGFIASGAAATICGARAIRRRAVSPTWPAG